MKKTERSATKRWKSWMVVEYRRQILKKYRQPTVHCKKQQGQVVAVEIAK
jgi:hypothetical protein